MRNLLLAIFILSCIITSAQTTILPFGSSWKYLDNGSNQATAWKNTSFNDAGWTSGNAELGYGDGDEATVVGYGNNAKKKYITTYFRKVIAITNPSQYNSFNLTIKRDDGAVVYVNGTEAYRSNMPTGTIGYTTKASSDITDDGAALQSTTLAASLFINGTNVIAVEIHQAATNNADMSFNLQLTAATGFPTATLTRGPYLQMVNQTEATLRWRTNVATDSKIEVGQQPGTYTASATNATSSTEHEVRITGLTSDSKYYYRFGSSSQVLQSAVSNYFTTAPPATATRKIRIAAFGDCGRNDNGYQTNTLNSYLNVTGSNPAEVLLLLGDNAYDAGTDAEYQSNFFNPFSNSILKNHAVFPAPGNHDYANTAARQADHNIPYYSNFTLPSNAQCGGLASNTEAYYSFDWGNIHFLSLDSYGTESPNNTRLYDTLGPQVTWIKNDLAANTKKWVIAYWHHPPFTMGSHNSDSETELVNIRQNFIRILERNGVDMILCGHSHNYERSYLLKNYYSNELSFNPAIHTASNSSAKYDGTVNSCPYETVSGKVNHGTVYVVAGSAGASGGVQAGYPHNALPFSVNDGGMLYFEVEDNRLDAKFIREDGLIADKFTIIKDANKNTTVSIAAGASTTLTASWVGSYSWSTGETTRSITVAPPGNATYYVGDGGTCLSDTFNVAIQAPPVRAATPLKVIETTGLFSIQPTIIKRGQSLLIQAPSTEKTEMVVTDFSGRTVARVTVSGTLNFGTGKLTAGSYFIRWNNDGKIQTKRFIVVE
jgi:hypothetical protein